MDIYQILIGGYREILDINEIIKKDEILTMVIILDEYQELKYGKQTGNSLLEYIQHFSQRDKIVIVPVFVSTLLPLEGFQLNGFNKISFNIKPLSNTKIINL